MNSLMYELPYMGNMCVIDGWNQDVFGTERGDQKDSLILDPIWSNCLFVIITLISYELLYAFISLMHHVAGINASLTPISLLLCNRGTHSSVMKFIL